MLKDYPVYINDTKLPEYEKWEEDYGTIETVNQTEAGTDQVTTERYGKLSVSAQYNCSSGWAARFATFRDMRPIMVKIYDIAEQEYRQRKMRLRNFHVVPVKGSQRTPGTEGLYQISFDLEEY